MAREETLTVSEAAKFLEIRAVSFLYHLCRNGILDAQRDEKGVWRISKASAREYLERRRLRQKQSEAISDAGKRIREKYA